MRGDTTVRYGGTGDPRGFAKGDDGIAAHFARALAGFSDGRAPAAQPGCASGGDVTDLAVIAARALSFVEPNVFGSSPSCRRSAGVKGRGADCYAANRKKKRGNDSGAGSELWRGHKWIGVWVEPLPTSNPLREGDACRCFLPDPQ